MMCTNNKCLGALYLSLYILAIPILMVIYLIVFIIYHIMQMLTCGYQCCSKEDFDTSGKHHGSSKFHNPWASAQQINFNNELVRMLTIFWDMRPVSSDEQKACSLPLSKVDYQKLKEYFLTKNNNKNDAIQYTWMGHASSLIQFDGFNILTDPVYSDRCSAVQWAGIKRFTPPPDGVWVATNLPDIDVLLISHDHYDHLDYNTIEYLYNNNKVKYYCVPLRIGKWLKDQFKIPKEKIYELDWWQSVDIKYKGHNITGINTNINNKDKNYNTFTSNTGSSSTSPLVPNDDNDNNDNDNKNNQTSTANVKSSTPSASDNGGNFNFGSSNFHKNDKFGDYTIRVTCTPCQHFSGRTLFDSAHRLWCSWAVQSFNNSQNLDKENLVHSIYFAGDTGYRTVPRKIYKLTDNSKQDSCCSMVGAQNWDPRDKTIIDKENELKTCPAFKEIGDKYGPFDVSMLPIGAYSPRWFMSCVHLNPYDACCVHRDLKSKKSFGIHWGTWVLTDEKLDEPPKLLEEMKSRPEFQIEKDEFVALNPGQTVIVDGK